LRLKEAEMNKLEAYSKAKDTDISTKEAAVARLRR
jgi:hypothetical protein